MKHSTKRIVLLILVLFIGGIVLLSYFYSGSRAGRLVSNKEYLESLRDASRGRKLAGNNDFIPTDSQINVQEESQTNLFEEILYQLAALIQKIKNSF